MMPVWMEVMESQHYLDNVTEEGSQGKLIVPRESVNKSLMELPGTSTETEPSHYRIFEILDFHHKLDGCPTVGGLIPQLVVTLPQILRDSLNLMERIGDTRQCIPWVL